MAPGGDFPVLRSIVELPTLLALTIAVGLILRFRARRLGTCIALGAGLFLYATSTSQISGMLLRTLDTDQAAGIVVQENSPPQAIVILAAGVRTVRGGKTEVGPLTLERLRQGARLHRDTGLPILVSGGPSRNIAGTLSGAMAASLTTDFRLSPVWRESRSRTTAENAFFSSEFLSEKGIASIYLVTHVWHIPRAATAFRETGIIVTPWPVQLSRPSDGLSWRSFLPTASGLQASQYAVHEWVGRIWYAFIGFRAVTNQNSKSS